MMAGPPAQAEPEARDRLQPALLDRLIDDPQWPAGPRLMSRAQWREAVLRDLGWLLNATQPLGPLPERDAAVARTVLNFGMPPLSGRLASQLDPTRLEELLRDTLLAFEPRLLPDTLVVRALARDSVLDTHNLIEFEISGQLWGQPAPLELLLRTRLDLEAGQIELQDARAAAPPRRSS